MRYIVCWDNEVEITTVQAKNEQQAIGIVCDELDLCEDDLIAVSESQRHTLYEDDGYSDYWG